MLMSPLTSECCHDSHAHYILSLNSRNPLASFVTLPFSILYMAMDEGRGLMVTTDTDKVIRVSIITMTTTVTIATLQVYDARQMLAD